MISYEGQVVLVTGAAGGLGAAYAEAFGERGAHVAVHDGGVDRDGSHPDPRPAAAVASELASRGFSAGAYSQDLSSRAGCEELVASVLDDVGRIDALVHSAGIVRYAGIEETSPHEWASMLAINAEAAWWLSRALWPGMVKRGYGRLVYSVSAYGLRAYPGSDVTAYGVGKAAQFGLMNGLAGEGAELGIKANAIEPIAATRIFRRETGPGELSPAFVAPAAVVLASRECPVSGYVINAADGEFQLQRYPDSARVRPGKGAGADALLEEVRAAAKR